MVADFRGSSPRMRGKPDFTDSITGTKRLIPAHAGKTSFLGVPSLRGGAHPRACGENTRFLTYEVYKWGSSPRMRGKPRLRRIMAARRGLIPAHAGKTGYLSAGKASVRAHPRACGENKRRARSAACGNGSSPRMRGKLTGHRQASFDVRLIPAHAGKTRRHKKDTRRARAHPRACGENAERSGVLALRSVRSWKTFSFPSSLKVTHCRAFVQLPFSRIRL